MKSIFSELKTKLRSFSLFILIRDIKNKIYFWYQNKFTDRFATWYDGSWNQPEDCLINLAPRLPSYLKEIIDLGCGSGRNFIPFNGKLNLVGLDICEESRIKWVQNFQNLKYKRLSVEQFTEYLETTDEDLSKSLIFSSGTLMYVSSEYQKRFYEICLKRGCRNFIFNEYPISSQKYERFKLPSDTFELKTYRIGNKVPVAHIRLDK